MGVLDDSYTKALLHFDGADASTTFTDESGKTWTPAGTAQIDTAQSVFGGASGLFDGNSDYISTPTGSDFDFGSGNLTIDFWVMVSSTAEFQPIFWLSGVYGSTYPDLCIYATSKTSLTCDAFVNTSQVLGFSRTITADQFNHIALIRNGNDWYMAVNGTLGAAVTSSFTVDYDAVTNVYIGTQPSSSSRWFGGWIDEMRVSKGIARWTSDFTPQTFPYCAGGQVIIWSS